jgi:hypothetical protein
VVNILTKIIHQLSVKIDKTIVENLMEEYKGLKKDFFVGDWEGVVSKGGRFSELVMTALKYLSDNIVIDLNNIRFGDLFLEMENKQKQTLNDELLFLAIPRVARSIYTLRSKKKVAHFKLMNPGELDATFVISCCDWILSSLLLVYHSSKTSDVTEIVRSLIKKQIPLIEEFEDGGILILSKESSFKEEFLLSLYHLNKRVDKKSLKKILNPKYNQIFTTT